MSGITNLAMNPELQFIEEPSLMFGFNQRAIDPRDGLVLFGPNQALSPFNIKVGVVGTPDGLVAYGTFVTNMNSAILSTKKIYGKVQNDEISRPSFPGFEAIFGIKWQPTPEIFEQLSADGIDRILNEVKNKKQRTNELVDLYLQKIRKVSLTEDNSIDVWFVVVPRALYFKCKPGSSGKDFSAGTRDFIQKSKLGQTSLLFPGQENYIQELENLVDTTSDFHHLLKARLIQERINIPVQIILDSTLNFRDKYKNTPFDENMKCHLGWTQSTTLYYKLGKLPWKLADIRDNVCYVGLIFKKLNQVKNAKSVCSAAQMFLRDGDGSVFRGNIGLWQSANEKEFHLDMENSEELIGLALDDFAGKKGTFPAELFIHGRAKFSDEEWQGFNNAVSNRKAKTKLVGVVIKDANQFKLFRDPEDGKGNYGVLRGMSFKVNEKEAFLMTRGFIPRLSTASSLEIPNPLHIEITRGDANLDVVLKDILALTKLNYNACLYGDGLPVTLRFSQLIGNILTATDNWKSDQRQFKFYI
jgi:hypothetical protein